MVAAYPREYYEQVFSVIHECLEEGYPLLRLPGSAETATGQAARRLDISVSQIRARVESGRRMFGMLIDENRYVPRAPKPKPPPFTIDELPHDGEPSAEELISQLTARHAQRKIHHTAAKLRQVHINVDGPIGLAFFGDPHVDDPGCAWGDLERDVRICRDTPGVLAVDVGDQTNNWVGRLQRLYADQEVTSRQARQLIEWLMGALPWLLQIKGNHDTWNTEKGDVADYIHRLLGQLGELAEYGQRLQLNMSVGSPVFMHVRHDFPGGSQFNPAHALVRETLFGYRDHIMVAGHRHTTGYIPVWHNDPRRLCHGFRCGAYKDFDHYAKEKGFQNGNWSRALGATIDPQYADNPVRHIKPWFDLEDMAEYLTWRRAKFELGYTAAA